MWKRIHGSATASSPTPRWSLPLSTAYSSAIATGRARLVDTEAERILALRALNVRFAPGLEVEGEAIIEKHLGVTAVLCIDIDHLSAKARKAGTD